MNMGNFIYYTGLKNVSVHIDATFYKVNVIQELTYAMIVHVIIEGS